jgi:DtxR family Mn-dependent transcriptional regulator
LSEKGLVEHEKFGPTRLTDNGIAAAQKLESKHETVKQFLMRVLGISESLASSEACVIEHTICDVTLAKMASLI